MSMRQQAPDPDEVAPGGELARNGVVCDLDITTNRDVRRVVGGLLAGRDDMLVDDAVLVADELVSNAHRHGRGPRVCRLGLINHGRSLRIEVDDASPDEPRIRTPDHTGGRGLLLVDRLASAWGVQHHADHKTVWAELAVNRQATNRWARHLAVAPDWRQLN